MPEGVIERLDKLIKRKGSEFGNAVAFERKDLEQFLLDEVARAIKEYDKKVFFVYCDVFKMSAADQKRTGRRKLNIVRGGNVTHDN